jgi:hypothetical protein
LLFTLRERRLWAGIGPLCGRRYLLLRFFATVALTGLRLWSPSGLFAFARELAVSAVGIHARIVGINIATNDLVVVLLGAGSRCSSRRRSSLNALVCGTALPAHMAEVGVSMHRVIAVQRRVIHWTPFDFAIHTHVAEVISNVDIRNMNDRPRTLHPDWAVFPTVVVDCVVMPVAIVVQPGTDKESYAEEDHPCPVNRRIGKEHHTGIIDGDVDVLRIGWIDVHESRFLHNFMLRGGDEIAGTAGLLAQLLHGLHHISGLRRICLAEGGGPVKLICHH